jgi:pimeloyl-ACP methyl ester carboxylesterase
MNPWILVAVIFGVLLVAGAVVFAIVSLGMRGRTGIPRSQGRRTMSRTLFLGLCAALVAAVCSGAGEATAPELKTGRVESADGVPIAYVAAGGGDVALLLIHGGFADSRFWLGQIDEFSDRYQVVAVDLAGHGDSGRDRRSWSLAAFGEDLRAVVDALDLKRVVLIGNSMGGPVALEAARIMPKRIVAVIGIDTLHDATAVIDPEQWEAYVQAWRQNYRGTCGAMARALFHQDADPELVEDVRRRMCDTEPPVPADILESFRAYKLGKAMAAVEIPVRSINGDLYPTNVEGNRQVADYDAVVMEHTGHYPMLETPDEFNRHLATMLEELGLGGGTVR